MKQILASTTAILITALLSPQAMGQSWSTAQRLNDLGQSNGDIKEPAVCAAAEGGFLTAYRYHVSHGPVQMVYRRYQAGSLSPVKVLHQTTIFGGDICQAGNGDIHVVWENWDGTTDVGWAKSSDGGLTWTSATEITNLASVAKIPLLAHFGASNGGDVVMGCGKADGKHLWYNRYNGSSWNGGGSSTGTNYNSEYELFGMCRSLQDGSVYRCNARGGRLYFMRYNGFGWSETQLNTPNMDFFPRQSIAVNPAGQVMVSWDYDNDFWSSLYTPGSGWGPVTLIHDAGSGGAQGSITAIPGSNDFYAVYTSNMERIRGKRWSNGIWQAEEVVAVGLSDSFSLNARVCAGADGSLYAAWERWETVGGNYRAQAYYSVKLAGPPQPTGTISGYVRDQFSVGVSGASVTTSGAGATVTATNGSYSMTVPVGTYNMIASKDFYAGQTVYGVQVNQGQTTNLNLLLSGQAPSPAHSLVVTEGNTANTLNWQNSGSTNLSGVMVRFSTTAAPSAPTHGTLLLDQPVSPGSPGVFTHSGLTNGTRVYYTVFNYFAGASRYYATGVSASGSPAVGPDFDHDGDVDQKDFGHFQTCYSGMFVPQENPACLNARLDSQDTDVDQEDLTIFLNCLSGEGVLADPGCAD